MEKIKKVLVVDDDDVYRYVTKHLLKKLNTIVDVQTAANGEDALTILKQDAAKDQVPHLIINDKDMPVLNGSSSIKEAQRLGLLDYSSSQLYKSIDRTGVSTSVSFIPEPLTREKLRTILVKEREEHSHDGTIGS